MSRYLMEHEGEAERLARKTDMDLVAAQLAWAGLEPGMRAIDVGAGTGLVAGAMASRVGPHGSVTALDLSHDRLAQPSGSLVLATVGDALLAPIRPGSIDFVWSRFLFEYLPDPVAAVTELTRMLAPGGLLVVADLDLNGFAMWPCSPVVEDGIERVVRALRGRWDPTVGRKLYHLVNSVGLTDLRVDIAPYHLYPGRCDGDHLYNWRVKLKVITPAVIEHFDDAAHYRRFVGAYLSHLVDEQVFFYSTLVTVVGRRPT